MKFLRELHMQSNMTLHVIVQFLLTFSQMMAVIVILLILLFLLTSTTAYSKRIIIHCFGYDNYPRILLAVEYGIHESSHALVAWVFRHDIVSFIPFNADKSNPVMGAVSIRFNSKSRIQKFGLFFVGVAPFFIIPLLIVISSILLYNYRLYVLFIQLANGYNLNDPILSNIIWYFFQLLGFFAGNGGYKDIRLYLLVIVILLVGRSAGLSNADIAMTRGHVGEFIVFAFLVYFYGLASDYLVSVRNIGYSLFCLFYALYCFALMSMIVVNSIIFGVLWLYMELRNANV